jgi:hypothetical protein
VDRTRLTDAQWTTPRAFLTAHSRVNVGQETTCRQFLDSMLWILGAWNSVFKHVSHWRHVQQLLTDSTLVRAHDIAAVIPPRANHLRPRPDDAQADKERHLVESAFNKIKSRPAYLLARREDSNQFHGFSSPDLIPDTDQVKGQQNLARERIATMSIHNQNPYQQASYAVVPTPFVRYARTSLPWQLVRFCVLNARILWLLVRSG